MRYFISLLVSLLLCLSFYSSLNAKEVSLSEEKLTLAISQLQGKYILLNEQIPSMDRQLQGLKDELKRTEGAMNVLKIMLKEEKEESKK